MKYLQYIALLIPFNCLAVDAQKVLPEIPTIVRMSSTDINRIHCDSPIKDVIASKEKGIVPSIIGNDVFIKYKVMVTNGVEKYIERDNDIYIICGNSTFSIVAQPVPGNGRTISLIVKNKNIEDNKEIFKGKDHEEALTTLWTAAYTDQLPSSFTVTDDKIRKNFPYFRDLDIRKRRVVRVEGEGIELNEFTITAKSGVDLIEQDFLIKGLVKQPLLISIEPRNLKQGDKARLFIIEQSNQG